MRLQMISIVCLIVLAAAGCSDEAPPQPVELVHYPIDSMDGVITRSGVEFDAATTSDGDGALRISATEPTTVHLYETGDIDVEDARVIYRAKLRTENVEGTVYLEMWCSFPGKGEFFTRALHDPLSGTQEWTSQETPFVLEEGENPDNFKVNVVVDGSGTVWVDDIHLLRAERE